MIVTSRISPDPSIGIRPSLYTREESVIQLQFVKVDFFPATPLLPTIDQTFCAWCLNNARFNILQYNAFVTSYEKVRTSTKIPMSPRFRKSKSPSYLQRSWTVTGYVRNRHAILGGRPYFPRNLLNANINSSDTKPYKPETQGEKRAAMSHL